MVLEVAKLVYASKTEQSILSQNLVFWDDWQIVNSVLNKGKSAILPLFNDFEELTNLKLHNISVTPNLAKKFIINFGISKASGPE